MKSETALAPPRYRNDAVFRSAERLIAVGAKRRLRHPLLRPALVLAGLLAAGLATAFWLRQSMREKQRDESMPAADASQPIAARRGGDPLLAGSMQPFAVPAPPAKSTDQSPPMSIPQSSLPAASVLNPTSPKPSSPAAQSLATAPQNADQVLSSALLVQAGSTAGLRLRGELRSDAAGPIGVEFQLYLLPGRLGGSVDGAVQFPGAPAPSKPFRITGMWFNQTIVLREVDDPARGSALSVDGYSFVLELPAPNAPDEITGVWRQGEHRIGTLTLKSVPVAGP